ncbi:hypothetical protein [Kitasatospora sp. P5_F3]
MSDLHALPSTGLTLTAGQAACTALDVAANIATAHFSPPPGPAPTCRS